MYKVDFLPTALADVDEIVTYITEILENKKAAEQFLSQLRQLTEALKQFPNANPIHIASRRLKHKYRKALVGNYLIFYWTSEEHKTVTISHVFYAKRDYEKLLLNRSKSCLPALQPSGKTCRLPWGITAAKAGSESA